MKEGSHFPARDAFLKLAETSNLIPVYREILSDLETPISVFKKLNPGPYSFLLESVEGGERWGRYTFVGFDPLFIFKSRGTRVTIQRGRHSEEQTVDDPLRFLESRLASYRPAVLEGLPRFFGGAVGYIGYETVSFFEPIPDNLADERGLPDTWFMAPRTVLVFDNLRQSIKVVSNVHLQEDDEAEKAYSQAVDDICDIVDRLQQPAPIAAKPQQTRGPGIIHNRIPQAQFESMVVAAKDYIRQGEIIQVVLSQGFETASKAAPFEVYRAIRRINPSPYLFFLQFEDAALLGSSPEVMVRLEGRRVTLRPIAGTRPRGITEDEDSRLEAELLADPKERAEHVMLVDLARNDVGRVAEYGTVKLSDLMVVEHYSHVMHIVSNIEGTLREGLSAFDVMRASFPAGTVSGAPKVRAMEIIHELEPCRRGPYAGAVGYFGFGGNMDLAITIRTIVFKENKAFIQAGAGIVADSVPAKEYEETVHKAKALFQAITMGAAGLE
ncbi:MAG: anthranilate synthase component I [Thermodesulfobacteriota bacterium]|nr:anthranilate synthase component I [Thermodesulfobacteriota bacterium]